MFRASTHRARIQQIIPTVLAKLLQDKDPRKPSSVMKAMLQMKKIDSKKLQQAYDQA